MLHHSWAYQAGSGSAGRDYSGGKRIYYSHHSFGVDQQAGHQRVFRTARRNVEQPRRLGAVGGCHVDCSRHRLYHRQDGKRDSRQYADSTYLSAKAPVFVAPAMDLDMYAHPSTQKNLDILRSFGNHIIEPGTGELASHLVGKGRMEEPENIIRVLDEFFAANGELKGKKIMITAGPTYEKIDPVRFIGNYSSGKMGFALAEECARRGAEVTLIAGPVQLETRHSRIRRIDVESAEEMYAASQACFFDSDAAILCAAVADFRPEMVAGKKIKREKEEELTLHLRATKDIAASLGAVKRKDQLLVGFALETNNEQQNAEGKLERKNFDFIVLNSLNDVGAGFRHDTNKISIIDRKNRTDYPLKSKTKVAVDIIDRLSNELKHLTLNS